MLRCPLLLKPPLAIFLLLEPFHEHLTHFFLLYLNVEVLLFENVMPAFLTPCVFLNRIVLCLEVAVDAL